MLLYYITIKCVLVRSGQKAKKGIFTLTTLFLHFIRLEEVNGPGQSYKKKFFRKRKIFPFFAVKLECL